MTQIRLISHRLDIDYIKSILNLYKPVPTSQEYLIGTKLYGGSRFEQNLEYDKSKPPIITIGCSFIYGDEIEQKDTFAYKLQKLSGRKVYNYGTPGHGPQHVLYKIQYSPFFKQKDLNPQYVIYIFITDHLRRMYTDYADYTNMTKYLKYTKRGNHLLLIDNPLKIKLIDYIKITALGRIYNNFIWKCSTDNAHFNLLKLYLTESKKSLNKKYKETKFVIIVYNSNKNSESVGIIPFHTDRWKEFEDLGFIVINWDNEKYDFLNHYDYITGIHPSGKVWDRLTPEIIERLNIK